MIRSILLASLLLGVLSPNLAWSDILSDRMEPIDQLLLLNAPSVNVNAGKEANTAVISLTPTNLSLIFWNPVITIKDIPTAVLKNAPHNVTGIFEKSQVPAVLTWRGDSGEEGISLTLELLKIDPQSGRVDFTAKVSNTVSETLSFLNRYTGKAYKSGVLENVALLIDDEQGRVIRYTPKKSTTLSSLLDSIGAFLVKPAMAQTINGCVIQALTHCIGANLSGANLTKANLVQATLSDANLSGANLSGTDLTDANLSGTDLTGVNLSGTDLDSANLSGTNLTGANLSYAYLSNGANLSAANLTGANLTGANLTGTNLSAANLSHAILFDVNLSDAILTNANVYFANFTGATMTNMNATGAQNCSTTVPKLTIC